jgi:NTE family protein
MIPAYQPVIGLALGSGSARGWAHVGVLRALEQHGIKPHIVCGSSIGALVGAAYVVQELDRFEHWVMSLGVKEVLSLMDFNLSGGFLKGERLMDFFRKHFADRPIESLPLPFGVVATSLATGSEVWLRKGSTADAVRASIALPGLFTPSRINGRLLIDGGIVNPVPVSLARAMGADIVIAVDLNSDIVGRHLAHTNEADPPLASHNEWQRRVQGILTVLGKDQPPEKPPMPSVIEVIASSINIMQSRITRSRMAGEPPEVIVAPRLSHLGLLDFHRAQECIEEGKKSVELVLPLLRDYGVGQA